jgi:hypothetical protein
MTLRKVVLFERSNKRLVRKISAFGDFFGINFIEVGINLTKAFTRIKSSSIYS